MKLSTMFRLAVWSGPALGAYWRFVRPWHLRWGATDDEVDAALPGDEFVWDPQLESTRAVTINAPADRVWPWLMQLGQHRAGFYSYSWLENLTGAGIHNADRIVSDWQHIEVGDHVWLHPRVSLRVAAVEPGRALVLEDDWAFILRAVDAHTTRLIVRSRGRYGMPDFNNALVNFIYWRLIFEPAHFIMERKMMLGIKERAERSLAAGAATAAA